MPETLPYARTFANLTIPYEGLHQLVIYASTRLRDESLEDPTWDALDCSVDQSDAMHWLAENACS
jgi:hypothetical protein